MKIYCSRRKEKTLSDFVGKDMWVKVKPKRGYFTYNASTYWYVKILDETPNIYEFVAIPCNYLKADGLLHLSDGWLKEYTYGQVRSGRKDFAELVKPIEALSTDELIIDDSKQ